MTAVTDLLISLFNLIVGILVPSGGLTPLAIVIWFGLLGPAIAYTLSLVFRLARGGTS